MAITVSDLAAETLFEALRDSGVQGGEGLRLREEGEQLNLDLDTPQDDDVVIERDGTILLIVGPDMEARFGDALIDVDTDSGQARLVLRRRLQG